MRLLPSPVLVSGLFLRNTMSLKSAIALIVCFILFSEEKYHHALAFLKCFSCPLCSRPARGSLRRECAGTLPPQCTRAQLFEENGSNGDTTKPWSQPGASLISFAKGTTLYLYQTFDLFAQNG